MAPASVIGAGLGSVAAPRWRQANLTAPQLTSTTSAASTSTTVALTPTTAVATTLPATTTPSQPAHPPPPKPDDEPVIELLPLEPAIVEISINTEAGEAEYVGDPDGHFSFATVSGYDSYRVEYIRTRTAGDDTETESVEVAVEADNVAFRAIDPEGAVVEYAWSISEYGFAPIMPDFQHAAAYEASGTLLFEDWDLIDGIWYARYQTSSEFVRALEGRGVQERETVGHVWLSPAGFVHSYQLYFQHPDRDLVIETIWRLADLGTATVESASS